MATKNDVTGDSLTSRVANKKYDEGWERIFGKKKKEEENVDTVRDKSDDGKPRS